MAKLTFVHKYCFTDINLKPVKPAVEFLNLRDTTAKEMTKARLHKGRSNLTLA